MLPENILSAVPYFKEIPHKSKDLIVHAHLYNPIGPGDWFIIAKKKAKNRIYCYGLVYFDEPKLGIFDFEDIMTMELPFGIKIRWDKEFEPAHLSDVINSLEHF